MINPYKGGRLTGPGLDLKEKRKLWGLAIGFLVVLGMFFASLVYQKSEENKAAQKKNQNAIVAPDVPVDRVPELDENGQPKMRVKSFSPEERRDLAEDDLQTGLRGFVEDGVLKDNDPTDPPEVTAFLIEQANLNHRVTRVPEHLYRLLPASRVEFEPGEARGQLASAFGRIVSAPTERVLREKIEGVDKLYDVVIRTADGVYYQATHTKPIDRKPGDWIQVFGIFYRLRDLQVPGEDGESGKAKALSLFLVKDVEDAYPPIEVTSIDPEWAKEVREKSFEEAHDTDERPFWLILNYVQKLGIEGYRKQVAEGKIEVNDFGAMAKPLTFDPDLYRFDFVSAMGKVIRPVPEYLNRDNPGKIERIHSAILLQPSGYLVYVVSVRPWSEYDFKVAHDFVRVDGIFYKPWQYKPDRKTEVLKIPLLIVTDVRREVEQKGTVTIALQFVIVAIAALIVGIFLFYAVRDRKARAAFRERLRDKKDSRRNQDPSDP